MNNSQTTIYTLSEQREILAETLAGELTKTIFKRQSDADAFEKLRNLIFEAKSASFRRHPKTRQSQLDKWLCYLKRNLNALSGITEIRVAILEQLYEIERIAATTDDAEKSEALADYCVVKVMADITDDIQHAVKVKEGVEIFKELCEIEHIAVVNEIQRIAAAEVSEPRWRITEGMRAVWQEIFNRDYLNPDRWEYAINFRYLYITHFRELECLARILGLQEFLKTIETPIDRMIREGREKDIIQILRLLKRRIATQRAAQEEGITQILRLLKMRIATQRGPSNPHA